MARIVDDQLSLDFGDFRSRAVISSCGRYRYELWRVWGPGPVLEWVMLNPSTADADIDDPTIRRCMAFTRLWGFDAMRVTNIFALRATDPRELNNPYCEPTGAENDGFVRREYGPITVCAWGSHQVITQRGQSHHTVVRRQGALMCLGYNKDGSPKHPLYVPADRGLAPWPKPDRNTRKDCDEIDDG